MSKLDQAMAKLPAAMDAVFQGPERKEMDFFGHGFNVKPARITRTDTGATAQGQLSHCLRFQPDDQMYYTITKEAGTVTSVDVKVKAGGIIKILAPIVSIVGAIYGVPIPSDKVEDLGRGLGTQLGGDKWEPVAQWLIANVAMRL